MSPTQMKAVATDTARSIRRRLAAAAQRQSELVAQQTGEPATEPGEQRADDARLDSLRGELVRELDRMAAADAGCSASFRRI
jgi:hypothetical protein